MTKNAVMMVNTAIDRLNTPKIAIVGNDGGDASRAQLQILGAFTEINRTVKSSALSGEVAIPGGIELDLGSDSSFNHLALDLALSYDNRIVPGSSTSVSIQVHGGTGDATLSYDEGDDFAAVGAIGYTGQEGIHSSQRLLIETAIAIMFSKLYKVDIKNCWNKSRHGEPVIPEDLFDKPIVERSVQTVPAEQPITYAAPAAEPQPVPPSPSLPAPKVQKEESWSFWPWSDDSSSAWSRNRPSTGYAVNANPEPTREEQESLKMYQNRDVPPPDRPYVPEVYEAPRNSTVTINP